MRIEAAGRTWIVEEELAPGLEVGDHRFYGVTFRSEGVDDDLLRVRWVQRPGRLTARDARDAICLQSDRGTYCAAWSLPQGLGFATDGQLTALLDSARA